MVIFYISHTHKKKKVGGGRGGIIRQSSYTCIINMYFWNKCCTIDLLTVTPANSLNHLHLVYWASSRVGWLAYKLCSRFVHISVKRIRSSPLLRKSISDNQIGLKHFATNRSFVQVHKDVSSGLKTVFACRFLKCSRIVWCNTDVCWFLNMSQQ